MSAHSLHCFAKPQASDLRLCMPAGMNACIQVGKLSQARQLVHTMQQQDIPVDVRVFNILLKGYRQKGEVSAVPGVLQELALAGLKPSDVTYNTLIDTYVTAGQLRQARQTCAEATLAGGLQTSGSCSTTRKLMPLQPAIMACCICTLCLCCLAVSISCSLHKSDCLGSA